MNWKYSALGVRSLSQVLATLPRAAEMRALMKPSTLAALDQPALARWYDGDVVIDSARAIAAVAGMQAVDDVSYEAMKRSIGPVVAPFLRVSLALFGSSPATVYRRMNDSLGTVMQQVSTQWVDESATAGRLTITHPDDVPDVSWASWKGSLRFVFDLCSAKNGRLTERRDLARVRTLVFDAAWS